MSAATDVTIDMTPTPTEKAVRKADDADQIPDLETVRQAREELGEKNRAARTTLRELEREEDRIRREGTADELRALREKREALELAREQSSTRLTRLKQLQDRAERAQRVQDAPEALQALPELVQRFDEAVRAMQEAQADLQDRARTVERCYDDARTLGVRLDEIPEELVDDVNRVLRLHVALHDPESYHSPNYREGEKVIRFRPARPIEDEGKPRVMVRGDGTEELVGQWSEEDRRDWNEIRRFYRSGTPINPDSPGQKSRPARKSYAQKFRNAIR